MTPSRRALPVEELEQVPQTVPAGGQGQHPHHVSELALVLPYLPYGFRVLVGQLLPQFTHGRGVALGGALFGVAPETDEIAHLWWSPTCAAKAVQAEGVSRTIGPSTSFESRTAIVPGMLRATSTHS